MRDSWIGGTCSTQGKTRNIYKFLVGNLRGKRPVGRPGCMSEIHINVVLTEI